MKLTRNDNYKDSGVDWLGEIPSDWKVKRIKEFFCQISETGDVLEEKTYVPLENIESFTGRLIKKSSNENGEITNLFKKGDLLFNKLRPYLGKVIECQFDGGVSSEAIVLRVKNSLNSKVCLRYFFYRLLSTKFIFQVNSLTTGVKMPRTNPNVILALDIGYTIKKEQIKIANFLDKKTSQIDKKIILLQEKKETYEELKKSLINETICRGIDKNVELKDSGIEWIGKIPKHWKIERLKNIFDERVEKNLKLEGVPITDNILSVMKDVGVINHRDKGNVGNKMAEDITGYKLVHQRDIVVNKMNVLIGSVGISKEFGALSVIYIILKTKSEGHPEYYDYVFRSKYFQRYLRTIATGILEIREAVNSNLFRHQELPKPSKEEQIQIAKYLDEKTSNIDKTVSKINDQIETLKEFRKTLINDVVTGKVRIQDE